MPASLTTLPPELLTQILTQLPTSAHYALFLASSRFLQSLAGEHLYATPQGISVRGLAYPLLKTLAYTPRWAAVVRRLTVFEVDDGDDGGLLVRALRGMRRLQVLEWPADVELPLEIEHERVRRKLEERWTVETYVVRRFPKDDEPRMTEKDWKGVDDWRIKGEDEDGGSGKRWWQWWNLN